MSLTLKGNPDELHSLTFESKVLTTIALLLRSTEVKIVSKALETILKFVGKGDKNKAEAKSVGILELLVPHLRNTNTSIIQLACMNCGILASLIDIRVELRRLGVIAILLDILSHPDLHEILTIEYATLTLSWMSLDYNGRNTIMKLNGIPLIAKFLLYRYPDVQKNSVEIFSNLFQNANAVKNLSKSGGLLSFFLLLKSEFEIIQRLAFLCLVRVTSKTQKQVNLLDSGRLVVLLRMLENKAQSEFHVDCLRIIYNCLEDPECEQFLCNSGLLALSIGILKKNGSDEVKLWTLKVLHQLFKNEKNIKLVQKEHIEKVVFGFMNSEVPAVQGLSTRIIAAFANLRSWRDRLREAGAIELLIPLLNRNDDFVRLSATVALGNMTYKSFKNISELRYTRTVDILAEYLFIPNFELQAAAAACLSNIVIIKEARSYALNANAMLGFIHCLQSRDMIVQLNACTAITAYISDCAARKQLLDHGVAPLVKLLSLPKSEIYLKTLWIISGIGVYNDIASSLCEHGIIPLLSQTVKWKHKGNYANLVIERIFATHLPAKYGYHGYLAATDYIDDVFFDVGGWSREKKFQSIKDLCIAPINAKQPIILVNFQQQTNTFFESEDDESSEDDEALPKRGSSTSLIFRPNSDPVLVKYLEDVMETIFPLSNMHMQAIALAKFVYEKMGGKDNVDSSYTYSPEFDINLLKCKYMSNVLPIGSMTKTRFRARSLLFKALADHIGIPCSLVRGNLRRIWNEVLLPPKKPTTEKDRPTDRYIVDLMYNAGQLYPIGSLDASQYCDGECYTTKV